MGFFTGTPGKFKKVSTLRPSQEPLANQAIQAGIQAGAGGAFGTAADYYRNNLSDNPSDMQAFAAPEMRRFNEQIVPDLAEQFAGMGSGALSSSGFRNAAVNAGTDLSERLGAIRAQLRQQSAQGLMGVGQQGLQQFDENIYQPGKPGFIDSALPGIASGLTGLATGGPLGGLAGLASSWLSQSNKGESDYYGRKPGVSAAPRRAGAF